MEEHLAELPRTLPEAVRKFFRFWSPRIIIGLIVGFTTARVLVGNWQWWEIVPPIAILVTWPIQEWLIHVFALHFKPRKILGVRIDFPVARLHRTHHQQPWNLKILFIPLHVYLYGPLVTLSFWWAVLPVWSGALTAAASYYLLALNYEWVHYIVHTRVVPKTWFYKRLWVNHRLHHFKNENFWHGVSMLSADTLMGTTPDPKVVPASATARTLIEAEQA